MGQDTGLQVLPTADAHLDRDVPAPERGVQGLVQPSPGRPPLKGASIEVAPESALTRTAATRGVAKPQATLALAWGVATNSFVDCRYSIYCSLL
jgi:hypothetical protein